MAFEVFDKIGALAFDKADCVTGADIECDGELVGAALNDFESCEIRIVGWEILEVVGHDAFVGGENKLHVFVCVGHKLEATAMEDGHGDFTSSGGDFEDEAKNGTICCRFFGRCWCCWSFLDEGIGSDMRMRGGGGESGGSGDVHRHCCGVGYGGAT